MRWFGLDTVEIFKTIQTWFKFASHTKPVWHSLAHSQILFRKICLGHSFMLGQFTTSCEINANF